MPKYRIDITRSLDVTADTEDAALLLANASLPSTLTVPVPMVTFVEQTSDGYELFEEEEEEEEDYNYLADDDNDDDLVF